MEEFILLPAVDTMMTKFIAPSSFTVKVHHVFSNVGMIIESIITSFKISPTSLGGGKQTTTAGEHISQCGRIKAATMLC